MYRVGERWRGGPCTVCECVHRSITRCSPYCPIGSCPQVRAWECGEGGAWERREGGAWERGEGGAWEREEGGAWECGEGGAWRGDMSQPGLGKLIVWMGGGQVA